MTAGSHQRQPGVEIDVQAVEDRGEVGGNRAALGAAHEAPGFVHQRQEFLQRDGGGEGAALGLIDGGAENRGE